ncbi:hypothetical protein POVWA1_078920 [Plasmodium ovale wallikeri]|uniref:STP1 protein n=1 Tax=Plasmodium ovale wallikeri TaxID=864142 RepID=A0A1A9AL10_PLAOA|nr:hypothetical protein POVWA1_078920 [Plasmodium ovale wallikeri]
MANNTGYTTQTHNIDVNVFITFIQGDIKNLILKYGHKNCGLKHEELCKEIKKIIPEKKKIIFKHMDATSIQKWDSEWRRKRNEFFNKLFQEEGFTYMCDSKNKNNNPSINQLLSKHIDFCKKKDERRASVVKNPKYSECVQYNSWIDTQRQSFTNEYLINVKASKRETVQSYFSTKKHPEGYNPLTTYQGIKLDCEIYNPA